VFSSLDDHSVISAARASAGGGPGIGRGGISREGGCGSDDWDEFARSLMRALPSTVIVVGPENWPVDRSMNVGMGCM